MPILTVDGKPKLICINEHDMMASANDSHYVLMAVDPPNRPGGEINARTVGTVVRMFYCQTCGYVECYLASITEPETWGPPKPKTEGTTP